MFSLDRKSIANYIILTYAVHIASQFTVVQSLTVMRLPVNIIQPGLFRYHNNQESEEAAGNVRTEEMITGVEDEGEIRTEERKEICAGTPLMATHA